MVEALARQQKEVDDIQAAYEESLAGRIHVMLASFNSEFVHADLDE